MQKYNASISIIRVIAMLSIVVGHICAWQGIYTYQLGAIGVEIFLLISGYLYGNREIGNRKRWLLARGKRILIPFWILPTVYQLYGESFEQRHLAVARWPLLFSLSGSLYVYEGTLRTRKYIPMLCFGGGVSAVYSCQRASGPTGGVRNQ